MSPTRAWLGRRGRAFARMVPVGFFGIVPAILMLVAGWVSFDEGSLGIDFLPLRQAASDFADGRNPWPSPAALPALLDAGTAYVYPPLAAFVAAPLALLPETPAAVVWTALLVAATVGALRLLGVRDWRCYGAAFLWGSVLSAVQTGNVTLLLVAGLAALWRFRRNALAAALLAGALVALKFFLWPLVVWLAATRQYRAAAGAALMAVGLTLVSWAAVGFTGFSTYPDLLRALNRVEETRSYTVHALGLDAGLPQTAAWAVGLAVGVAVLAACVVFSLRGDEARAFALVIAAALAFSSLVWLHYFALLLVPVAIARPRVSALWLLPLAFWLGAGTGNGDPWQTVVVLLAAAAILAAILREPVYVAEGLLGRRRLAAAVGSRRFSGAARATG